MQYKYYIYKVKPGPWDRYQKTSYNLLSEVTPSGQWNLNYKCDNKWKHVWRWEFDGEFTFKGDDYDQGDVHKDNAVMLRRMG
jgi:hypothetical protein